MNIEEKAKAYDEALERAKKLQKTCDSQAVVGWCEYILPELAESEDENIRGAIIDHLKDNNLTEWAAWLENQGQKSAEWHREDEQNLNACLGYIPDEFLRRWLTDIIHIKYDKSTWSHEDDVMVHDILGLLPVKTRPEYNQRREDWLKSLKCRVQPEQEWSEEDENMYTRTLGILGKCYMGQLPTKVEDELNWLKYRLKYLIPQNQWKPSDEQLYILNWLATNVLEDGVVDKKASEILYTLYDDLKKLKG
jgi:hypothetical protein